MMSPPCNHATASTAVSRRRNGDLPVVLPLARNGAASGLEEKRTAAGLEIIHVLTDAPILHVAMARVLEIICRRLDWDAGVFQVPAGANGGWTAKAAWPSRGGNFRRFWKNIPAAHGPQWRRPVWISDFNGAGSGKVQSRATATPGAAAFLPVLFRREFLGVIALFSRAPRAEDRKFLQWLRNIGAQVGQFVERERREEALRAAHAELKSRVHRRTAQLTRANAALKAEIVERKQTEAALRESEERFRLMVEGVQDCAVFMLDPKGRIATWNDAARRLHGWSGREIIGRHFSRFFPKDHVRDGVPRQVMHAAGAHGRAEHEGWRVRKDGARFWASVLLTALRDASGKLRGFSTVVRDFTGRREAELALEESRARLQAIMDNSPALIFLKDLRGRYLLCNRHFEAVFHLSPEKALGKTDFQIFPREQATRFRANDRAVLRARQPLTFDEVATHDDGPHTSIVTKFPLFDRRGKMYAVGGVATDITDRLRAQEALRRSEAIMADFFERSPLGLFWINPRGRVTRVNRAGLELVGGAAEQCIGKPVADFLTDHDAAVEALARLARGEVLENHRVRWRRRGGPVRHVVIDANGFWENGALLHSRWFVRDITRRVELEREILAASERERQRIGRDLHDDLCQQLAGIEFLSQSLGRQLPPEMEEQSRRSREIARMIREAITHTRELAHGLSPTPLDSAGLRGALQELTERARKLFKVDCQFQCREPVVVEDETVTFHLYRIAQEAVNNAIKHGRARKIAIQLAREAGRIVLRIRDYGMGMKSGRTDATGMGLRVMQYRAGVIGGTLGIESTEGDGTTIVCSLPEYLVKRQPRSIA